MAFASKLGPVVQVGDDVFISSDVVATVSFDDATRAPRSVNDLSTYQGRRSDLADTARRFVPAWVTYQGITSWAPEMAMGDREGHLVARAAGAKVESIGELPEVWRRLAARHFPHVLKDSVAALSMPPAKLG
jgi:hypothetical protein